MSEYERVVPAAVRRFLTEVGEDWDGTRQALTHTWKVFHDLGCPAGHEPYSYGFLYAYLVNGPADIGERLRRTLTPHEIRRVMQRARNDPFADAVDPSTGVTTFNRGVYEGVLETLREIVGSKVDRHRALVPLIKPMIFGPVTGESRGFTLTVQRLFALSNEESVERADEFLNALFSAENPLELPGKYVLVITPDGARYRADMVQTFLHGNVVEALGDGQVLPSIEASLSLQSSVRRPVQLLVEEFEQLLNSPAAREADFQRFFETHPEFLLLLGNYDEVRSQLSIRVESAISPIVESAAYRPDFFLHDPMTDLWDLLDIKKARYTTPLVVGSGANAHHALSPSAALTKALQQMRQYQSALEQSSARQFVREKYGLRISSPRCILLMGRSENFPVRPPFSRAELLRELGKPHDTELITYDQIWRMCRHLQL